jgi:hypothetical protein
VLGLRLAAPDLNWAEAAASGQAQAQAYQREDSASQTSHFGRVVNPLAEVSDEVRQITVLNETHEA